MGSSASSSFIPRPRLLLRACVAADVGMPQPVADIAARGGIPPRRLDTRAFADTQIGAAV